MRAERLRAAASPPVVIAVVIACVAAYGYVTGRYGSAVAFGVAGILVSALVLLADG